MVLAVSALHGAGVVGDPTQRLPAEAFDTAKQHVENCRVPATRLIGDENAGLRMVIENLNAD